MYIQKDVHESCGGVHTCYIFTYPLNVTNKPGKGDKYIVTNFIR